MFEAAGFRSGHQSRRWPWLLGSILLVLLGAGWFLSQHLTITTGGRPSTPARQTSLPSLPAAAGFPRTEAGAAEAAAGYLTMLDGPLVLDPDALTQYARSVGSSGYAEQLAKDSQDAAAQLEGSYGLRAAKERGLKVAIQPQPLAYKLTSPWNGWSASVAVWWIELIAIDGVTPTMALWETSTLSLVWEGGGWHISQISTDIGPTPGSDGSALPEQLSSFERYRHVV